MPPATVATLRTGVVLSKVALSAGAVSAKATGSATRKEFVSEFVLTTALSVATE